MVAGNNYLENVIFIYQPHPVSFTQVPEPQGSEDTWMLEAHEVFTVGVTGNQQSEPSSLLTHLRTHRQANEPAE